MKFVILVYLFYLLYDCAQCNYQQLFEIVEREHPKKANLLTDFRHLQYLNPVKVITKKPSLRRFGAPGNYYTLFPPVVESRRVGVPDSPYFPLEKNMEVKSRVKKVVADTAVRYKRSADDPKEAEVAKVDTTTTLPVMTTNVSTDPEKSTNKTPNDTKSNVTRSAKPKPKKSEKKPAAQRSNSKPKSKVKSSKKSKSRAVRQNRGNKRDRKKKPASKRNSQLRKGTRKPVKGLDISKSARRIIAGRDTDISKFPYVISIQKNGIHWCAGALLNPTMFISTANCFWKSERISRMSVRAGSSYVDRGGVIARIQEIEKHPYWSVRRSPNFDIALGLLNKKLRFTHKLHAVDLPNHMMSPPFEDLYVTSWGAVRTDGIYEVGRNRILQVYCANILPLKRCNDVTKNFGIIVSTNFICLEQIGKTGPCTSDTGAPAVNDGVVWGLASFGIRKKCGSERYPAMFSFLASPGNLLFITNATHRLMSDPRIYPLLDRMRGSDSMTTESSGSRSHNATLNVTEVEVIETTTPVAEVNKEEE